VGSYRVNGVAEIHSRLLRETVLHDFSELWPQRFTNVTNGVTPRRFMRIANPELSALITARIGDGWLTDLERLRELEGHVDDPDFRAEWRRVKGANKARLAGVLRQRANVEVDDGALFDVMIKRLHEYKRQTLKILHVLTLYERIKSDPDVDVIPRVVIFGAKAAPGYHMAKLIIRLINAVATVVNVDRDVNGRLKIVFPANYNVTLAERIIPAADLSEQISLAGKEASGTGNMKLTLNGALTIGTLDGANIEIRDLVGAENFFLFGLTEPEVVAARQAGYEPRRHYEADRMLKTCIDKIASGVFSPNQFDLFQPIVDSLLNDDPYMVLADYASYIQCQDQVAAAYRDAERWTRMSILNVARCGYFSSDRSIREYCQHIWRINRNRIP
jgi:starch phosphorylase